MKEVISLLTGMVDVVDDDGEVIMSRPFFKTPYNHDRNLEATRTALYCRDESLTDQSFKEDADINVIIQRVLAGQQIPVVLPEHFGDTRHMDPLQARIAIAESNATFYRLPPSVREEFMNDPGRWTNQVLKDLDKGDLGNLKRMGIDVDGLHVLTKPGATPAQAAGDKGGAPAPPETPSGSDKGK